MSGSAAGGQEVEHALVLLARGEGNGHQVFGEGVVALTLGTERALAPENEGAQLPLGMVVGWLEARLVDEIPQRLPMLEDVRASPRQA